MNPDEEHIKEYIKMSLSKFPLKQLQKPAGHPLNVQAQIIVIPNPLNNELVERIDPEACKKLKSDAMNYKPSGFRDVSRLIEGDSSPHQLGNIFGCSDEGRELLVHRNGCIQHIEYIGRDETIPHEDNDSKASAIRLPILAVRLIHVLQFAGDIFSQYNYSGDVKILVKLQSNNSVWGLWWDDGLGGKYDIFDSPDTEPTEGISPAKDVKTLSIERDLKSSHLKSEYSKISASIMNRIYDCFRVDCPLFDKNGMYIDKELAKALN